MHRPIAITILLLGVSAAQYTLQDDYLAGSFANNFNFYTDVDPTNGYVNYISQSAAEAYGLYSTNGSGVRVGADYTSVATGRGRSSVRLESKKTYNHGLIILDLNHMPEGCGTWPAFWLLGPNWPNSGEVDIIEGVNSQATNSFAMHTSQGCSITNSGTFSGEIATSNCDVNAPGQGTNVGCAIKTADTQSYGAGFNAAGGGVYATEWTSQAITIWFFPRNRIPADISSGTPNPSNWGVPHAQFGGACDIDTHIVNQQIVFTNTFCGDWGGQVWSQDATCSALANTCQEFVRDNPAAFSNAYWDIRSLRVYQSNGMGSNTTAPYPTGNSTGVPSVSNVPSSFSTVTTPAGATEGVVYTTTTLPCPDPTGPPVAWSNQGHGWNGESHPGGQGFGGGRGGGGPGAPGGWRGGWKTKRRAWFGF